MILQEVGLGTCHANIFLLQSFHPVVFFERVKSFLRIAMNSTKRQRLILLQTKKLLLQLGVFSLTPHGIARGVSSLPLWCGQLTS